MTFPVGSERSLDTVKLIRASVPFTIELILQFVPAFFILTSGLVCVLVFSHIDIYYPYDLLRRNIFLIVYLLQFFGMIFSCALFRMIE